MPAADPQAVHRAIDAVWKIEAPRLVAALVRTVRDVSFAEDLAQDALLAALENWPEKGIPENPGAWLTTAAKRRAIDHWRHQQRVENKHAQLAHTQTDTSTELPDIEKLDAAVDDDMLRLMFIACHPVLSTEARIALTLKLLGGLSTQEIARAFLVPEATIAQRIVRAKRTLGKAGVSFEEPDRDALLARLDTVLEVIYLIFNEGYSATSGNDWLRPALSQDALRLGRMLTGLAAREPEAHALVALMELQASRFHARIDADGEPVLLADQNRALWDHLLIRRGLAALQRARELTDSPGSYLLQAEIAACHARAASVDDTDWPRIAMLYELLGRVAPSPVVELNRAVAVSMAFGPGAALPLVNELNEEPALARYHLLPSVRGDLLFRLGRYSEAQAEFQRAAGLAGNTREQQFLLRRANECDQEGG